MINQLTDLFAAFVTDIQRPHNGETPRPGRQNQLRNRLIAETREVEAENVGLKATIAELTAHNRDQEFSIKALRNIAMHFKEFLDDHNKAHKDRCGELIIPSSLREKLEEHAPKVLNASTLSSDTRLNMLPTPEASNSAQSRTLSHQPLMPFNAIDLNNFDVENFNFDDFARWHSGIEPGADQGIQPNNLAANEQSTDEQ